VLNRRTVQLACIGLFLLAPALANAATRPWLSGSFGYSGYAMDDVNDDIGEINATLAGSGLEMDEITKGLSYGLAFGLDVSPAFSIGLGYDRLTGQSDVSDPSGSIEYDLPANLLRGFGRYSFQSTGKAKGFLEASLGRVSSDATATLTVVGVGTQSFKFEGSGLAFEGAGGVSYWTSPTIAMFGLVGYRVANVEDVEVDGQPAYNVSGENYSIDYSGIFMRLGLTVAFGQ
jgi:hypothetical protein